jgi:hypothetical protein
MRVLLVIVMALLSAGCTYEVRGNEVWACGEYVGPEGQVYSGCQDTGVRIGG